MLNFESAAGSTISPPALSTEVSTMKPTNCLKTVHRLRISSTYALLPYRRCNGTVDAWPSGPDNSKAGKALLDRATDRTLRIANIVPEAQGFWEKLGIGVQNREPGAAYSDTLTQEAFAGSPAGQNAGRAQGDQRGDGSPSKSQTRGAQPEVGSLSISEPQWFAENRLEASRLLRTARKQQGYRG